MTPNLLKSIRNRDKLAIQIKKHPNNEELKQYFKKTKNIITSCIRTAKDNFYKKEIDKNKHDSKKLWKTINEINNTKPSKSVNIKKININGQIIDCQSDKQLAATKINQYFSEVGKTLADQIKKKQDIINNTINTTCPHNTTYSTYK